MSKTSTAATTSTNRQPSIINANSRVPPNSGSGSHRKLSEKDFDKAHRPNTAPIMDRSSHFESENRTSYVEGNEKVPNSESQTRRQHRPASSINMRSARFKERKNNSIALEKQTAPINPNVVSKLRQNRNYQPPRRKTRNYNNSEITPSSKQGK